MTEQQVVGRTPTPVTLSSMVSDFRALGIEAGQTVLVHSSMSKIGWISGGAQAVIQALLDVLGESGTLMMPSHTSQNSDPANWRNPPVPEAWWQVIRDNRPAFDPHLTPTREMGKIAELFRTYPGVKRSQHPIGSFAAVGPNADYLLADHLSLGYMFGDDSPIGKFYELDGYVLLLGVTHYNNTSLHLAEYRAEFPGKHMIPEGVAMLVNGQRQWVSFEMMSLDNDDFDNIGTDYLSEHPITMGHVGMATAMFFKQRPLVDFAVTWLSQNRT